MSSERVMRLGLTISAKQSQLTISKDVIRILLFVSIVFINFAIWYIRIP